MKNATFLILLFLLLVQTNLFAQYEPTYKKEKGKNSQESVPVKAFYAGFGTSLYGKYGFLGAGFGARISPKTIGEFNFGMGGWGGKAGFSLTTNAGDKDAWCPSIGFGRSFGVRELETQVEVVPKSGGTAFTGTTKVNLDPMNVIHFGVQRQFLTKKGGRLVLELGYSLPITNTSYSFADTTITIDGGRVNTDMVKFSDVQKTVFKLQNPGGIMFNFSYMFGFGNYN